MTPTFFLSLKVTLPGLVAALVRKLAVLQGECVLQAVANVAAVFCPTDWLSLWVSSRTR